MAESEKKFNVELTQNDVKMIKNACLGWHDVLVKMYSLNIKPMTAKKRKYKKSVDELKKLFTFFNGLK